MPFDIMFRSVNEVTHTFSKDASFVTQMLRMRLGAVPGKFPLLISWKINDLAQTSLPDTFMETTTISLCSEEELARAPTETPDVSKESFLLNSLLADPSLHIYAHGTCALCKSSGVQRLDRCSRCKVARYCGTGHQREHWSMHKHHCKRLRELRLDAIMKAETEAD